MNSTAHARLPVEQISRSLANPESKIVVHIKARTTSSKDRTMSGSSTSNQSESDRLHEKWDSLYREAGVILYRDMFQISERYHLQAWARRTEQHKIRRDALNAFVSEAIRNASDPRMTELARQLIQQVEGLVKDLKEIFFSPSAAVRES